MEPSSWHQWWRKCLGWCLFLSTNELGSLHFPSYLFSSSLSSILWQIRAQRRNALCAQQDLPPGSLTAGIHKQLPWQGTEETFWQQMERIISSNSSACDSLSVLSYHWQFSTKYKTHGAYSLLTRLKSYRQNAPTTFRWISWLSDLEWTVLENQLGL